MARNTKLTPETQNKIVQAIRIGATYKHAADYAGISEASLYGWLAREKKETKGIYFEFLDAVKRAGGEATVGWLAKIEKAATEGSWQAAAWKLERRHPDDYGRSNLRVDLQSDNTHTIKIVRADD